jgi:hypothetical protein
MEQSYKKLHSLCHSMEQAKPCMKLHSQSHSMEHGAVFHETPLPMSLHGAGPVLYETPLSESLHGVGPVLQEAPLPKTLHRAKSRRCAGYKTVVQWNVMFHLELLFLNVVHCAKFRILRRKHRVSATGSVSFFGCLILPKDHIMIYFLTKRCILTIHIASMV